MRWVVGVVAALVVSGVSPGAEAADPPGDGAAGAGAKVTAEDLYQQGLALAGQGKWAEAAAKLSESNRLDRAPGTTINLADCYEHMGKLASAWTLFVEAATIFHRRTPPDPRGDTAQARADSLYPKLSRLTIEVPAEVRGLAGLVVRRDGEEVGAAQFGSGIAVDPGAHVIEVAAPGKETWRAEVTVEATGKDAASASPGTATVMVPVLVDAKDAGGGAPGSGGAAASGGEGWPWQRKVALGLAGVGVAGVAVGAVFGADALGKHDELQKRCSPGVPRACDAEGVRVAGEQSTVATAATIGFAAGGALVAAGVVLWLVAPSGGGGAKERAGGVKRVWMAPVVGTEAGAVVGGAW